MQLFLSCGLFAIVAWLIGRAIKQRGLLQPILPGSLLNIENAPTVSVIVPARDEELNIEHCLRSLLNQQYSASRFSVLVVDDHSSDRTASIVAGIARNDPRVALLRSPVLPPHWVGKSHACWVGAASVEADVEWLCFVDADMRAEPALLASAVATACSERIDLLSLTPRQKLGSFAERLIMPCGFYLLGFRQNLRSIQSSKTLDAPITGQFILVCRRAYRKVGGHAAVRHEISEDVWLARILKRSGARVALRDGHRLLSTRMYTGWRTLWPGIVKNLVDMLGGPPNSFATAICAVTVAWAVWLIPLADGFSCSCGSAVGCVSLVPALAAAVAALGLHIAGAAHFRIPLWYGLLFPLGYSAGALMVLDSIRRRLWGRVNWKGRTYP